MQDSGFMKVFKYIGLPNKLYLIYLVTLLIQVPNSTKSGQNQHFVDQPSLWLQDSVLPVKSLFLLPVTLQCISFSVGSLWPYYGLIMALFHPGMLNVQTGNVCEGKLNILMMIVSSLRGAPSQISKQFYDLISWKVIPAVSEVSQRHVWFLDTYCVIQVQRAEDSYFFW